MTDSTFDVRVLWPCGELQSN